MSCLYAARSLFIPKSTAWCVIRRTIAAEASSSATNEIKMPPASPSEEKSFSPKLQKIVDDIQQLTLIEASDLNELLRQRLNIKDVPIAAAPVAQAAKPADGGEEQGEAKVKSVYVVKLVGFDDTKKVALIKEMKSLVPGLNLVQAKKFVESVPQIIKNNLSKEEADQLKASLESLGGKVVLE